MADKREFPPRVRRSTHNRDASLIIIATEGTDTEKSYFVDLASPDWYQNSKVHVEVLDHIQADSDPEDVIGMLNNFKRKYFLHAGDQLWLVIDVDRWGDRKLAEIARLCTQKEYWLGVSNPCFEIWLLLHVTALANYSEETKNEFRTNGRDGTTRTRLERELVTLLGKYSKVHPDPNGFLPYVKNAIAQAQALDTNPDERWPNDLGSRVYQLIIRIIAQ